MPLGERVTPKGVPKMGKMLGSHPTVHEEAPFVTALPKKAINNEEGTKIRLVETYQNNFTERKHQIRLKTHCY